MFLHFLQTLLSCHPEGITAHSQLFIPEHLSSEAKGLLQEVSLGDLGFLSYVLLCYKEIRPEDQSF